MKLSDEDIVTFAEIFATIKPMIEQLKQMTSQQLGDLAKEMPAESFKKARDLLVRTGRLSPEFKDMGGRALRVRAMAVPILRLLISFYDDLSEEEKARIGQLVSEQESQEEKTKT